MADHTSVTQNPPRFVSGLVLLDRGPGRHIQAELAALSQQVRALLALEAWSLKLGFRMIHYILTVAPAPRSGVRMRLNSRHNELSLGSDIGIDVVRDARSEGPGALRLLLATELIRALSRVRAKYEIASFPSPEELANASELPSNISLQADRER
jgi:hypothetical protein